MKILVCDVAASTGGALAILKSFYGYISSAPECRKNEWVFLLSDRYVKERENIKVILCPTAKKGYLGRLFFDAVHYRKIVKRENPDVIFSLQNMLPGKSKKPTYLYVHQSIPFQNEKKFSFFKKEERLCALYQHIIGRMIFRSINRSTGIFVQADWMKRAVLQKTNANPEAVYVIRPTVETMPQPGDTEFDASRFFYPAFSAVYKNQRIIDEACLLLEQQAESATVVLTTEDSYHSKLITAVGRLPFDAVTAEYFRATLIFPSYIETVGLPLLEAKQAGAVILAVDCPYARETVGEYPNVYYFPPFDAQALALLMHRVLVGEIRRKPIAPLDISPIDSWQQAIQILLRR